MRRCGILLLSALLTAAMPAASQDLVLPPNAEMARELRDPSGTYALPVGPWTDGGADTLAVSGDVTRQAWRIAASSLTTLQLMDQLAAQLESAGYETLLRCEDAACGGFDFRFALSVLPPPEMFVDLFDYRFLSARRAEGGGARHVTLLISRSGSAVYVQVTRVVPAGSAGRADMGDTSRSPGSAPSATIAAAKSEDGALVATLRGAGRAVLADLDFGTGAAALGEGPFASLGALAAFLKGNAARRLALVGHTDTVGGFDSNLALSQRRAEAVMQRLISVYDVPAAQMEAKGIAYLAPRASNAQAAGREANRRVEAVLLSTE